MTSYQQGSPPTSSTEGTGAGDRAHRALLAHAVQQRIIPRLIQAHASPESSAEASPDLSVLSGRPVTAADVRELAGLVQLADDRPARAFVETLRLRGVPVETLFLDLLAQAARHLGDLWEEDVCSFADVTVGVGRLQQLLRALSAGLPVSPHALPQPLRVLLLPCPGEQHTYGLVMVSEFFRSAGWDVVGGPSASNDAVAAVQREWFDVVGFSLAGEIYLPRLAPAITAVRKASINQRVGILVGGPMFLTDPGLASEVGADAVAVNGSLAPEIAETLVKTRGTPC